MRGILVFDNLNDLIFTNNNRKFLKHLRKSAQTQGLIPNGEESGEIGPNIIIQLFSPIVTSQRIMICQFGNSYTSVQCGDGIKMVFDEYMGFLFMHIGDRHIDWLKRTLGICVTIVKHLCGPDVDLLKSCPTTAERARHAMGAWQRLQRGDQAALLEAVEPLLVNASLASAAALALAKAAETMATPGHALLLVENKLLSLHSTRGANDLAAAHVIFLALLCADVDADVDGELDDDADGEDSDQSDESSGEGAEPGCRDAWSLSLDLGGRTHSAHLCPLQDGVTLVLLTESGHALAYAALCDALAALATLQAVQLARDAQGLRTGFARLDAAIKGALDGLHKMPGAEAARRSKGLRSRWDTIRPSYVELQRGGALASAVRCEAQASGLRAALRQAAQLLLPEVCVVPAARDSAASAVRAQLAHCSDFLKVKARRNFTLGSRASLSINRYLEEFPGLVHFLYTDRTAHRVTAPCLDFSSEETVSLTRRRVWKAVEFARQQLSAGRLAVVWKDTTFHYAYFLWFEDNSGSPLKPKVSPTPAVLKELPIPGIMCGDFYQALVRCCFPKAAVHSVRCFELLCVHLGLATGSCVLEHSRRLAATVWEVTGVPHSPADLL